MNFNLFAGRDCVEAQGRKWALMLHVENVDSSRVDPATGSQSQIPDHPVIAPEGPGFVIIKGNQGDQDAVAPIAALHELHRTQAAQLAASAAEHQRKLEEHEAWKQANPPGQKDNVMWFRPRKGSRYLQAEGGAR